MEFVGSEGLDESANPTFDLTSLDVPTEDEPTYKLYISKFIVRQPVHRFHYSKCTGIWKHGSTDRRITYCEWVKNMIHKQRTAQR